LFDLIIFLNEIKVHSKIVKFCYFERSEESYTRTNTTFFTLFRMNNSSNNYFLEFTVFYLQDTIAKKVNFIEIPAYSGTS